MSALDAAPGACQLRSGYIDMGDRRIVPLPLRRREHPVRGIAGLYFAMPAAWRESRRLTMASVMPEWLVSLACDEVRR